MQWPTLIVDDFFADPHAVVKLSKTFKYTRAENGRWPGTRSPPLHEADRDFFLWSTQKIMALLYPMDRAEMTWEGTQHFACIPYNTYGDDGKTYGDEGWVHNDVGREFTSIIYLSNHSQSGTCLYEGKHFNTLPEYQEEKERFYRELKDRERTEKYKDKNNSKFHKKVELFSNFNRLVLFDSYHWHAFKNSGADKEDRLTLITFFNNIRCKHLQFPIAAMRRI